MEFDRIELMIVLAALRSYETMLRNTRSGWQGMGRAFIARDQISTPRVVQPVIDLRNKVVMELAHAAH